MQKRLYLYCCRYFNRQFSLFSAMHCDVLVLGYILEYLWSYLKPPKCIQLKQDILKLVRNRRNATSATSQQLKQEILKHTLEFTPVRSPTNAISAVFQLLMKAT